jgi:two-component sensor histidine kinase/PAS domain-containing protein
MTPAKSPGLLPHEQPGLLPHEQTDGFWRLAGQCLAGCAAIASVTFICLRLQLPLPTPTCLYLVVIVLLSLRGNFLSSLVVLIIAAGCLDYYFVAPTFSFGVAKPGGIVAVLSFLITAAAITHLASKVRQLMKKQVRRSEVYLAEAQRLSRTGSFGWTVSTGEIHWSEETFQIFQLERTTKPTVALILQRTHPEDLSVVKQVIEDATKGRKAFDFEHRLIMPDGSVKHVHVVTHSEQDGSDTFEFVGAIMDVTAAKEAEERLRDLIEGKDALFKELHHRVRNNLQLVSSLLSLQASRIADPAVAKLFEDSRNRVRSMALAHECLYRAGHFAKVPMRVHVQDLCSHVTRAFGLRHVELTTDIDEIALDLDRAISTGLIINELVSNALKHAFPDGRKGCVRVELKRLNGRRCALAVMDDGVGLPADLAVDAGTMGLQLVHDLSHQIHGAVSVAGDRGTRFGVVFDVGNQSDPSP